MKDFKNLYTNLQGNKIYGYRTKHELCGKDFNTVVLYNEASYKEQMKRYEERKAKIAKSYNRPEKETGEQHGEGKR